MQLLDVIPLAALLFLGISFVRRRHELLMEKAELERRIASYRQSGQKELPLDRTEMDRRRADQEQVPGTGPEETIRGKEAGSE